MKRSFTLLFTVLGGGILFLNPVVLNSATFAIIKSKNLSMFNEAVVGFKVRCKGEYLEYDIEGKKEKAINVFKELQKKNPDVVITLGEIASVYGKYFLKNIPIVFSMVTDPDIYGLRGENITGVSRMAPVDIQLRALKEIIPDVRKVGVIYNPKRTSRLVESARNIASAIGIELLPARVDSREDAPRTFRIFAAQGIDAFWLIPDPTVVTPQFFKLIRDYTLTNAIPLLAFSPDFVKAGALLSLSPTYTTIGDQTCRIALKILDGVSPSEIPISYPKAYILSFNLKVAKKIGLESIATNAVIYAGSRGYIINVEK